MSLFKTMPRFLRLQFSLRTLLASITLVALGLTVYRWPWHVETLKNDPQGLRPPSIVITPWRRAWNGKPEKHGTQHELDLPNHWGTETLLSNGDLIHEWAYLDGHCVRSHHFVSSNRSVARKIPTTREVRGVRRLTSQHGDETVTQICPWRNYERHGLSTWTSSQGTTLQTAEFERGRIVKWNGRPIGEAIEEWLAESVRDAALHPPLLAQFTSSESYMHWAQNYNGQLWWKASQTPVLVHYGSRDENMPGPTRWAPRYRHRSVIEVILEMALGESGTLDYRYGTLCVVPICSRELAWRDPTNYTAVKFPAGSQAAEDWLATVPSGSLYKWPARELREVFQNTAITIDTSAIDEFDVPLTAPLDRSRPDCPRLRRDLFGHILYDAGYRCEQRGETILILPQKEPDPTLK
jgi:hypothetical protein